MAGKQNEISYQTAFELLQSGNARYVSDLATRPNATMRRRLETGSGQWPFAIVLTCADSRVSPELVFDQGIGDLFVARVAGNVASDEVIGSIQYAVKFIKTELVVVLGHEGCGAVAAAIEAPPSPPKELAGLVGCIKKEINPKDGLQKSIEKNAKAQAAALRKRLKGNGMSHAKVKPASYCLKSGEVHWL